MKALLVGLGLVGILSTGATAAPRIMHAGDPDAYVMVYEANHGGWHPVQLEYLACVGARDVVWFEDGSCEPHAELLAEESGRRDR